MAVPSADLEAAVDLFSGLGAEITHRATMGGEMLHADGRIFAAIMADSGLHIRARGDLAERLAEAGATQFVWVRPSDGRRTPIGYWSLPEAALDDPLTACDWAREAVGAAFQAGD